MTGKYSIGDKVCGSLLLGDGSIQECTIRKLDAGISRDAFIVETPSGGHSIMLVQSIVKPDPSPPSATPSSCPVDIDGTKLVPGQRVRVHFSEGVREGVVVKPFPENLTAHQPGCWVDVSIEGCGPQGIPSYILEVIETPATKNMMVPNCCENDITPNRYAALMNGDEKLTQAERSAGWHFCPEWDFLLIHKDCSAEECSCDLTQPLPSAKDNPHGLHRKYIVTHADGRPVDPKAVYFVLRLDGDHAHNHASRVAALKWAEVVDQNHGTLGQIANDLRELVKKLTQNSAPPENSRRKMIEILELRYNLSNKTSVWASCLIPNMYTTGRATIVEVPE